MSEEAIREVRLQKLARMRELGHDPYAVEKFERTDTAKGLLENFEESKRVSFAGRVVSYRLMGKAGFAHISDGDAKIQGYFKKDELGETGWELYNLLDIGDHVGVRGYLFVTKTGEKSIHVEEIVPLSKALHAIPIGKEKEGHVWYGLTDVEARYRHRHLDLIANADARKMLIDRALITREVRNYFDSQGYLEVETPMLQLEAGGAAARPFLTHYNAYEMDVKLRISLELYLKRLICGDIPAVYEIGRVFRNEGVSNKHNPEFTLLEFYEAYVDLETMMRRVEEVFRHVAEKVLGTALIGIGAGRSWRKIDLPDDHSVLAEGGFIFKKLSVPETAPTNIEAKKLKVGEFIRTGESELYLVAATNEIVLYEESPRGSVKYVESEAPIRMLLNDGTGIELEAGFYIVLAPGEVMGREETDKHLRRVEFAESQFIDFSKPWKRVYLLEEIEKRTGISEVELSSLESAKKALGRREVVNPSTGKRIHPDDENNLGGLIEKLLEVFVEPTLQEPTFVVGYPIETSPLAKKEPGNPKMTRRFEGYVLGREVCNAFSEINDPIDQRERFEQQLDKRAGGDDEAHPMDEEFIYALESGMPPCGGCGIGIDRMAMLLTGAEVIREILFFPMMKPQQAGHEQEEQE